MRSLKSTVASSTLEITSGMASEPVGSEAMQRSPWHSPVPYLFGGLAAMLGLIAFALLVLACSYWKLSRQMNGENNNENGDDEEKSGDGKGKGRVVYEEQFVVILAGDDMPSCMALPVCSKSVKLVNNGSDATNNGSDDKKAGYESVKVHMEEEVKHEGDGSEESNILHLHDDQTEEGPESSSS